MQKKCLIGIPDRESQKKLWKIMKLTIVLLIGFMITASAANTYSQKTRLDVNLSNISIKGVLGYIEQNSEFVFLYRNDDFNTAKKVSIDLKDATINQILDEALSGEKVVYDIYERQIVIRKAESLPANTQQIQKKEISGTVKDPKGLPLPGVSVVIKGTTSGTVSDSEGKFKINVPSDAKTLVFSFIGLKTQEIVLGNNRAFNITLTDEAVGLDEVVAVGYGTQRKGNLTGSVSSIKSDKLTIAPVSDVTNTLGGQLPGLVSKQSTGLPGADAASLSIRGFGDALVIVDGVESSLNTLDANQIESVSILKDGAASIYGARAGNGVILVTTKRGIDQKPIFTINSSMTNQGITKILKPASSGQQAEMQREAWIQAGNPESTAPWTAAAVQKFYAGTDPLYPNTDWFHELIREWAPEQQNNISVRGGSDKIKYYGFIGHMDQQTMIKKNGGYYERYNLQSNIDAKVTDNLSLQLDLATMVNNNNTNARGMGIGQNMWQDYWNTQPWYPAHLPDPTKVPYAFGAGTGGLQVTSNRAISGYNNTMSQDFKGTLSLNYNISAIKGLSAKAFVNYYKSYNTNKNFQRPVNLWKYDPASQVYTLAGTYGTQASLNQSASNNSAFTQQYSLNYDNTFKDHHITAMALYESIDYKWESISASRINFLTSAIDQMFAGSTTGMSNDGSATEMGRESYIGRFNYSYKNKYLLESIIRADASAKFPSAKRWGYFPSVSLGWVVSQEGFMKQFSKLDNLKLRASYGQSGNDAVGNFQYLSGYAYGATYILGAGPQQGLVSTGLANPNLTWERMKISNLGVDFSFLNRKIYGVAEVFYRERSGIPATQISTLPSTFGASLPPVNLNSLNDRGFELNLGTSGKLGEVSYDFSGNISWSRSKWNHFEEPNYTDLDQKRIYQNSGKWTDRTFGYLSDGLFTSQSQIDQLNFDEDLQGNKTLRPGDIRYKDVNKDGKLDWKDQVDIGKGQNPHWMVGFSTNLKYKNFDFTALFQGAFGYYTYINLSLPSTLMYESRWTTTNNNPNAIVPRLGGAPTNANLSDYYYKKSGYLRLKSSSLGYTIPKVWLDKIAFSQIRFSVSGTNLLTYNRLSKYGQDPEAPNTGYYYPQQRTISLGVNASF